MDYLAAIEPTHSCLSCGRRLSNKATSEVCSTCSRVPSKRPVRVNPPKPLKPTQKSPIAQPEPPIALPHPTTNPSLLEQVLGPGPYQSYRDAVALELMVELVRSGDRSNLPLIINLLDEQPV
jgi:hypothetical protein